MNVKVIQPEVYEPMTPYNDGGRCTSEFAPDSGLGTVVCQRKSGHRGKHCSSLHWTNDEEERP